MTLDEADPAGLIASAYGMEIGPAECRSIFLDWLLRLPAGADEAAAIAALLAAHGQPDHPMTEVLRDGLARPGQATRRGGPAARRAPRH